MSKGLLRYKKKEKEEEKEEKEKRKGKKRKNAQLKSGSISNFSLWFAFF